MVFRRASLIAMLPIDKCLGDKGLGENIAKIASSPFGGAEGEDVETLLGGFGAFINYRLVICLALFQCFAF